MEMFKIIDLLVKSTQDQTLKESLLAKYMERMTEKEHSPEYESSPLISVHNQSLSQGFRPDCQPVEVVDSDLGRSISERHFQKKLFKFSAEI